MYMKFKKMLMGVTATVCAFSVIAPLNAHASEVEKNVVTNINEEAVMNVSQMQQNISSNPDELPPLIRTKDFHLSQKDVSELKKMAGIYGTGWGLVNAWAKKLGKSATWINMMLLAVPALGVATIDACNKRDKGVIITRTSYGATHTFTCRAK
ncbi:hypothetical protein [Bacillus thuringiensis]|nr:hypothetical protein [Bacillus thuringiensis]